MADKELTMIYYGVDSDAAKVKAAELRAQRKAAQLRHAEMFDGIAEPCSAVTILPCVSAYDAARIKAAYGDKVPETSPTKAPPIVPLPPVPLPPRGR